MKEHDVERIEEAPVKKPSKFQGLQLMIVQSSVCVAAILIALLLRVIGGDIFTDLSALFRSAMLEETLLSGVSETISEITDVSKQTTPLPNTVAVSSESLVSPTVYAPFTGGVVTSSFGEREDPFEEEKSSNHEGVDIAAPLGTPLVAFMSGTVCEVGYEESGYGHYMIVQCDDNYSYLYAHCDSIDVSVGQQVKAGDTVGTVGSTGRSTGSHLHFEWRESGIPINPMTVLPQATYA